MGSSTAAAYPHPEEPEEGKRAGKAPPGASASRQAPLVRAVLLPKRPRSIDDAAREEGSAFQEDRAATASPASSAAASASTTSIDDRSIDERLRPRVHACERLLVGWLRRHEVAGAAGLVRRFGWRAVYLVVCEMVEWRRSYRWGQGELVERVFAARFKNPGGFLNWALQPGNNRRPRHEL